MRTGLQTLQEENKAIHDITKEIGEDVMLESLDTKDRDTIQSK